MKMIITGASGFIGRALHRALNARGNAALGLNSKTCDLRRPESLLQFREERYDYIFHLAAWTQAGDFCLFHLGEQWVINQQINTNVLDWWQRFQPQAKLVSIGTSCSYDPALELKEENYLLGSPIESLFTYAMTKRMLHAGQMALNCQFGLSYLTVVASTLYGPDYHDDGRQMHFIFDLIAKIIRGKLYDDPVVLWGDGYQRRELVYIDDFVDLLLKLSLDRKNELINVGSGGEFEIREFARIICRQVGYDFNKIQFDRSRYVGARSKCLDIARLKDIYADLSFTPLEAGLEATIQWFLKTRAFDSAVAGK